jgi:hypothetical protein
LENANTLEKMKLKQIQVTKEQVEKELNDLQTAIDKGFIDKKNKMVQDLLKVYGHLKHNGKIIDIFDSFQKAGVDDNLDPKLAIVRADAQGSSCYIYKYNNGSCLFTREVKDHWSVNVSKAMGDIRVPSGTFAWSKDDLDPESRHRKCAVPLIPPRINLAISTQIVPQYYYILFEPEGWVTHRAHPRTPRDPILGKMLTNNLFGVLATWDLTDLEMKIIEGMK